MFKFKSLEEKMTKRAEAARAKRQREGASDNIDILLEEYVAANGGSDKGIIVDSQGIRHSSELAIAQETEKRIAEAIEFHNLDEEAEQRLREIVALNNGSMDGINIDGNVISCKPTSSNNKSIGN